MQAVENPLSLEAGLSNVEHAQQDDVPFALAPAGKGKGLYRSRGQAGNQPVHQSVHQAANQAANQAGPALSTGKRPSRFSGTLPASPDTPLTTANSNASNQAIGTAAQSGAPNPGGQSERVAVGGLTKQRDRQRDQWRRDPPRSHGLVRYSDGSIEGYLVVIDGRYCLSAHDPDNPGEQQANQRSQLDEINAMLASSAASETRRIPTEHEEWGYDA
jgi:hypothetical protein